ncbi:MAG TPA: hypothetical protein VLX68_02390 [Chitinivibrionales bacterium]|nr:hypothetical protein [Chitinivibrionales bacterium]
MPHRRNILTLFSFLPIFIVFPSYSQVVYRQPGAPWYVDISTAQKDSASDGVMIWLANHGGWGLGHLQIDYSFHILTDNGTAPMRSFVRTDNFYDGECDYEPVPVPAGGALEGETGYQCLSGGDCHLIVMQNPTKTLFEMWGANIVNDTFYGGCLAVWHLDKQYDTSNRGEQCTSADVSGLPIAPLLFTADEVAAGAINHAVRFVLPNNRIRHNTYVRPASNATSAASGGDSAIPYGARLRLMQSYDISGLPSPGARVLAQCLKTYGMILADAGNVTLMAMNDSQSVAKWDTLLAADDLSAIPVSAFEMVAAGQRFTSTGACALQAVHVAQQGTTPFTGERVKVAAFGNMIRIEGHGRTSVTIFSISGRIVAHENFTKSNAAVGIRTPGVYVVEVVEGERTFFCRAVVER